MAGGWLLGVLAVASVAVLVGGRMADQIRRVGLLKAVGGTPGLVAVVLLAEYVVVAVLAAAAGLTVGWLAAPLLSDPSAGLVGRAGAPPLTMSTVGVVTAVALGVATAATLVPAVRAARTSTVRALADSARPHRRTAWLIADLGATARPAAARVAGGRPTAAPRRAGRGQRRRHRQRDRRCAFRPRRARRRGLGRLRGWRSSNRAIEPGAAGHHDHARRPRGRQRDLHHLGHGARRQALLGAGARTRRDPEEVSAGLSAAQLLPAVAGAILGIPGGIALFAAVSDDGATIPPLWQLLAVVAATALVLAGLTAIPARVGARRPVAEILQSEHA